MPAADTKIEEEEAALLQALKEVMSEDRYPMFIPGLLTLLFVYISYVKNLYFFL